MLSSAAFHEAMDVARQYGAPVDSNWKQDGQNTVISLALAQAEQTGWNSALNFLVSLTEQPPAPKPAMPQPFAHLSDELRKTFSAEDLRHLETETP